MICPFYHSPILMVYLFILSFLTSKYSHSRFATDIVPIFWIKLMYWIQALDLWLISKHRLKQQLNHIHSVFLTTHKLVFHTALTSFIIEFLSSLLISFRILVKSNNTQAIIFLFVILHRLTVYLPSIYFQYLKGWT
jgi:hypothetical protein